MAVIIDAMVMPPVIMPSFKSRQRKGLSSGGVVGEYPEPMGGPFRSHFPSVSGWFQPCSYSKEVDGWNPVLLRRW